MAKPKRLTHRPKRLHVTIAVEGQRSVIEISNPDVFANHTCTGNGCCVAAEDEADRTRDAFIARLSDVIKSFADLK